MQGTRLLTVLVALGLIVGSVPGGALASATGTEGATDLGATDAVIEGDDANASDDESAGDDASQATVGQQLATVIAVTDDEVSSDVEASSLDAALEGANESERAAILAERAATLRERADTVVADQRDARVAYEDGEIARGEFAQRLAVLAGQARTVDRGFERVDDRADDVSALELRAAGYDRSANADARQRLNRVTGSGASALLAQYTGERVGEFSLTVDGGVSIEVETEGGERSREIEREQPGNGTFQVSQSEALAAATAALSADVEGAWRLRSVDRDADDGYYEFEFAFFAPETTGVAEVSVDGETGEVFAFEEELEPREAADDDDADDEADDDADDETPLAISIANGTAEPGATVTLRVTAAGEPVAGARVELGDRRVGETDADGRITVALPDTDEIEIEVEDGEREGDLEMTLRSASAEADENEEIRDRLDVTGSVDNGTVTVSVRYDGEGVSGVSVAVAGESVGTTDESGTLSFDAPALSDDKLPVTLVKGGFEAELEFEPGDDGSLALDDVDIDERDEDDDDDAEADDDDDAEADDDDDAEADDDDDAEADDDEDADGTENDEQLSVTVVSGDPASGATVTLEVTDAGGEPVDGAAVEIADESVGETDADGRITVTLPEDDEADIVAIAGDREGDLELEFELDADFDGAAAEENDDGEDADDEAGDDE